MATLAVAAGAASSGWIAAREIVRNCLDPDTQLVERCLSSDAGAWEELVRVHSRRVYGICYRFTGRDNEAQDLTQEVFLRIFRTLKSFRATEGSFTTWMTRLTRNLLIDNYRRTRQDRVTDSIENQLPILEQSLPSANRPETRGKR